MRLKLIIMNIIYVAVSGVCLFFLLTRSFININLGYTVSRENFKNVIGNSLGIDSSEVIDEKGVKLDIKVNLSSKMCFETAFKNDTYPIVKEKILDNNLDSIANSIREPLAKIDMLATIKAVSVQTKTSIYADIYDVTGSSNQEQLAVAAGINDEYLDGVSTTFLNQINKDGQVFSTSMSVIYNAFNDMYDSLAEQNALFALKTVDSTKKQSLDQAIAQPLSYLGWLDDGNNLLTEDDSLCYLLGKMFGFTSDNSGSSSGNAEPLLAPQLNSEQKESSRFNELIKEMIYSKIDSAGSTIGLVFRIIGFVHIFVVGVWGLFALFCIIKSLFKNPGIFFGFFFWLNFIIEIILGILLVFVLPLVRSAVGLIPVIGTQIATFIKPFTIAISSSTTITAFCSLGILISGFLYMHWKRKRKDEI